MANEQAMMNMPSTVDSARKRMAVEFTRHFQQEIMPKLHAADTLRDEYTIVSPEIYALLERWETLLGDMTKDYEKMAMDALNYSARPIFMTLPKKGA